MTATKDMLTVHEAALYLAERGVRGKDGAPLRVNTLYGWFRAGLLKRAAGLPRTHVCRADLETLLQPEEEQPARASRRRRPAAARHGADWQRRQDEADAELRRLGVL